MRLPTVKDLHYEIAGIMEMIYNNNNDDVDDDDDI